ncbi:MAG TPA: lysophospholipid acyltransferase family protein [Bryobacteraceae bacterium]|nr:lysophospholipid acyltransferase family protein [Bryobacteraceae bacterium]
MLPPALESWGAGQPFGPVLRRWALPQGFMAGLARAREDSGAGYARALLEAFEIRFEASPADLERIPRQGRAIVVANHPYGIVEGLILTVLLESVRPDYKIVANSLLAGLPGLRDALIPINPFETLEANIGNRRPLRACLEWLGKAGIVAMFPAGEVAHFEWIERSVTDPEWKTTAARLALKTKSPVVPVFFEGANSLSFQLAGGLHPQLRTISLIREFHKLRGRTIPLRIGNAVPAGLLASHADARRATEYLRSRTFFLSHRPRPALVHPLPTQPARATTIDSPESERLLAEEVAALPVNCELLRSGDFSVYAASAAQIPRTLGEIGRRRELAFRLVGEGTGKEIDLDRFDNHYYHLFLWNRADSRLAGAYRLALTTEVLQRSGIRGLYTSTLFRFEPEFFHRLGPAMEMGRSFVSPEYQKSYAPLLLLWKGITRFIERHPEAAVLFGAVSISRDYRAASRRLMATYLSRRAAHELARLVAPRMPFRARETPAIKRLALVAANIEDISQSIADIEPDGKGIPVLVRQYLKAGGKLLAFNVDPQFSDALDALLLADLRSAPPAILERCLGKADAKTFVEALRSKAAAAGRAQP